MSGALLDQFHFYLQNQADFVRRYNGKTIAIKDYEVIGVFDSEWAAVRDLSTFQPLGTFLVQQVSPGSDAYTVSVVFNEVFTGA